MNEQAYRANFPKTGADPKGQQGGMKPPMRAVPTAVLMEAALGMGEGMIKYGFHNWRYSDGVETMTYIEAAERHLNAFKLGEDLDPDTDSKISHITKAIVTLMVLRDAQINGQAIDNRPPPVPVDFLRNLNETWKGVRARAEKERERLNREKLDVRPDLGVINSQPNLSNLFPET